MGKLGGGVGRRGQTVHKARHVDELRHFEYIVEDGAVVFAVMAVPRFL